MSQVKNVTIRMLSRNPDEYLRETKRDIQKIPRNYDPTLHPFAAAKEYQRAVNAAKLERVFAKPFIGSLDGHRDGVSCLHKHPTSLSYLYSGSCDGVVKIWDLSTSSCIGHVSAHEGSVNGICTPRDGSQFISCGIDKSIKRWRFKDFFDKDERSERCSPAQTILGKTSYYSMDHHWKDSVYVTCGDKVDIWKGAKTEPVQSYDWGFGTTHAVKFNPVETNLVAVATSGNSLLLYDIRGQRSLRNVVFKFRVNQIAWNPMEAFVFTLATDDYSLLTHDLRKLKVALKVHSDHTAAVTSVDYSPTGREFVSGSYDKTLRLFRAEEGRSYEIYHTKRMQRVAGVKWSYDSKFIVSASDEMNIRLWKANASEKLGVLRPREQEAFNYGDTLKKKFEHHPEVRRIRRHRHVPKAIYSAAREHRIIKQAKKRKEANKRAHSKPGSVPFVPEKFKHVVREHD